MGNWTFKFARPRNVIFNCHRRNVRAHTDENLSQIKLEVRMGLAGELEEVLLAAEAFAK